MSLNQLHGASPNWPKGLISYLRLSTRKKAFDFNSVADDLRIFCLNHPEYTEFVDNISVENCRINFAADYGDENNLTSAKSIDTTLNKCINNHSFVESPFNLSSNDLSEGDTEKRSEILSFEESLNSANQIKEINKKKMAAIFDRVLSSISSESMSYSLEGDAEFELMKSIRDERLKKDQLLNNQIARKRLEAEEMKKLNQERESLRNRFNDVEDGFFLDFSPSEIDSFDKDCSADVDEFDILKALNGPEFDKILREVEKELPAAVESSSYNTNSELGEVLDYLDKVAASNSNLIEKQDVKLNIKSTFDFSETRRARTVQSKEDHSFLEIDSKAVTILSLDSPDFFPEPVDENHLSGDIEAEEAKSSVPEFTFEAKLSSEATVSGEDPRKFNSSYSHSEVSNLANETPTNLSIEMTEAVMNDTIDIISRKDDHENVDRNINDGVENEPASYDSESDDEELSWAKSSRMMLKSRTDDLLKSSSNVIPTGKF
jgi:hypothetical protein